MGDQVERAERGSASGELRWLWISEGMCVGSDSGSSDGYVVEEVVRVCPSWDPSM